MVGGAAVCLSVCVDEFERLCQRGLGFGPDGAGTCHSVIYSIGNESAPIQLAQCWFPALSVSIAKILIYFSNKIYRKKFYQTALGNCYGLKLAK